MSETRTNPSYRTAILLNLHLPTGQFFFAKSNLLLTMVWIPPVGSWLLDYWPTVLLPLTFLLSGHSIPTSMSQFTFSPGATSFAPSQSANPSPINITINNYYHAYPEAVTPAPIPTSSTRLSTPSLLPLSLSVTLKNTSSPQKAKLSKADFRMGARWCHIKDWALQAFQLPHSLNRLKLYGIKQKRVKALASPLTLAAEETGRVVKVDLFVEEVPFLAIPAGSNREKGVKTGQYGQTAGTKEMA